MERPLAGKNVVITGAGVRIGKAIATAVSGAGAAVAVHFHRSESDARATVESLRGRGGTAAAFAADLRKVQEIRSLIDRIQSELGPIDALVNSAATFRRKGFLETTEEDLEEMWLVNARAPFLLAQEAARAMRSRGGGDIVNVLDVGGALNPWRNYSAYCMSKAALASLTQCLALELAPDIRVNGVAPGTVLPTAETSTESLEELRRRIPQKRIGTPEDIAAAVLFFLTGPRFITGQILAVDGGRSLGSGK